MPPATQRLDIVKMTLSLALVTCAIGLAVACGSDATDSNPADEKLVASILAVGDTGEPWGPFPQLFEGQLAVGVAMQRENARARIDALVLLGDNFYPTGLLAREMLPRIVENIARPYCDFIDPSPELAALLDDACADSEQTRPRLLAVIGNHDLESPGSLDLQRREIPHWVRNWDMPAEDSPAIRELPGGLSLILLNSTGPWDDSQTRALALALKTARGPWRVIIGHRPPISGHPQLSNMVARAARESERVVHAYLAGHVHALVAIRGIAPAPALTVIAGSGSHAELQQSTEYRITEADLIVEKLGFVRVDVVTGAAVPPRLRLTLMSTPPSAALAFLGNNVVARYEIGLDGSLVHADGMP